MADRRRMGDLMRRDTYQIGREAGTADLPPTTLNFRPVQLLERTPADRERERAEFFRTTRDLSSMVNPERFASAVSTMPLSQAPVEYEPSYFWDFKNKGIGQIGRDAGYLDIGQDYPQNTFNERFQAVR